MSVIQSQKKKKANKKKTIWIASAVFCLACLLFYGAVKFFALPNLQIVKVDVVGTRILPPAEFSKIANEDLSGNYFFFFPKKNILLYPKKEIKNHFIKKFPAIRTVDISLSDTRHLTVTVIERDPFSLWCGKTKPVDVTSLGDDCYYVDKTGFIFHDSPSFSGNAYFTLYGTGSVTDNSIPGHYFVKQEIFEKIISVRDFLLQNNVKIDNIYLGENGYAEFFNAGGLIIKWNTDQDIDALKQNMQAVFRSESWKDGTFVSDTAKANPLEYIDFRFGNKVFYRRSGEGAQIPETEVSSTTESVR